MKIHKRTDVTDETAINIPKKAFSQSLTRLGCCFWSCGRLFVIFFTNFNWLLDGPKILVWDVTTTPPPLPPPSLHLGPCLQALIFHWQFCEILTCLGEGESSEKGINAIWHKIPLHAQNKFSLKDLHIEGIYFHRTASNHLASPSSQEETIVSV